MHQDVDRCTIVVNGLGLPPLCYFVAPEVTRACAVARYNNGANDRTVLSQNGGRAIYFRAKFTYTGTIPSPRECE